MVFGKVMSASTEIVSNEEFDSKIIGNVQVTIIVTEVHQGIPILLRQRTGQNSLL